MLAQQTQMLDIFRKRLHDDRSFVPTTNGYIMRNGMFTDAVTGMVIPRFNHVASPALIFGNTADGQRHCFPWLSDPMHNFSGINDGGNHERLQADFYGNPLVKKLGLMAIRPTREHPHAITGYFWQTSPNSIRPYAGYLLCIDSSGMDEVNLDLITDVTKKVPELSLVMHSGKIGEVYHFFNGSRAVEEQPIIY